MTSLKDALDRLDLSQYLESFISEGFDTWDTLMDITETDLEVLGVKLGHRRKLQRAIVNSNKDHVPLALLSLSRSGSGLEDGARSEDKGNKTQQDSSSAGVMNSNVPPPRGKRKYRRHPKPDEYAPERPPSAYVIFSNQMRDKLKGQDLSFTEIAKAVGERWQELDVHEKEPCEKEAQQLKDRYYAELGEYKKTPQYAQYQNYLTEFKAKHSDQRSSQGLDNKKQKIPNGSVHMQSQDPSQSRGRVSMPDGESSRRSPESVVSSNEASVTATSPTFNPHYQPDSPNGSEHSIAYNKSPNMENNLRRFPPPQQVSEDGHQRNHHHTQHKLPLKKPLPVPFYQSRPQSSTSPTTAQHQAHSRHPPLPSLTQIDKMSPTLKAQYTLPPLDNSLALGRTMPMPTPMAASSGKAVDTKAKTSLATLLLATEQVDRDADRSNTSSGSSRTPQS